MPRPSATLARRRTDLGKDGVIIGAAVEKRSVEAISYMCSTVSTIRQKKRMLPQNGSTACTAESGKKSARRAREPGCSLPPRAFGDRHAGRRLLSLVSGAPRSQLAETIVGCQLDPVELAQKPTTVEAPAPRAALYESGVTVRSEPVPLKVALQVFEMVD